jgi:hypothetical protein
LNSSNPCVEAFESFFTAISCPFASIPCNIDTRGYFLCVSVRKIRKGQAYNDCTQSLPCTGKKKNIVLPL